MNTVGHRNLDVHLGYSTVTRADQYEGLSRLGALRAGEPRQFDLFAKGE